MQHAGGECDDQSGVPGGRIRNYGATREQAAAHVQMLLGCLKHLRATVFYLTVEDVAGQLRLARRDRGQAKNPEI